IDTPTRPVLKTLAPQFQAPAVRRPSAAGIGARDHSFGPVGSDERPGSPIVYAIVNIAGVQTKVTADEILNVAHLAGEPGTNLQFDQVLLLGDGDRIAVGRPTVKGASVKAEIVEHLRGEKLKIFKFKRRREYRRRRGYRSELTRIRVTAISG